MIYFFFFFQYTFFYFFNIFVFIFSFFYFFSYFFFKFFFNFNLYFSNIFNLSLNNKNYFRFYILFDIFLFFFSFFIVFFHFSFSLTKFLFDKIVKFNKDLFIYEILIWFIFLIKGFIKFIFKFFYFFFLLFYFWRYFFILFFILFLFGPTYLFYFIAHFFSFFYYLYSIIADSGVVCAFELTKIEYLNVLDNIDIFKGIFWGELYQERFGKEHYIKTFWYNHISFEEMIDAIFFLPQLIPLQYLM